VAESNEPAPEIGVVAVIGAGPAGRNFAQSCLAAGYHVIIEDVLPARLRNAEADLSPAIPHARLDLVLTVEDAVRNADLAVDFVPDELESKLEIFSMIDRMAPPRTILCTPSEALSITDLASCVYRPDRCLILRGAATPTGWNVQAATSLVYPASVAPSILTATQSFFASLGVHIAVKSDLDQPMLVKNTPQTHL
jgi:3-hydroxybutyryl-CoA dehydrogenase